MNYRLKVLPEAKIDISEVIEYVYPNVCKRENIFLWI